MESIDKLREALIAAGESKEAAWEAAEKMRKAVGAMEEVLEAFESLRRSILDAFAPSLGYLEELAELLTAPLPPKEKPPRPPRSAGPQNKGRSWTRQPPRLARSCCRKMRR